MASTKSWELDSQNKQYTVGETLVNGFNRFDADLKRPLEMLKRLGIGVGGDVVIVQPEAGADRGVEILRVNCRRELLDRGPHR